MIIISKNKIEDTLYIDRDSIVLYPGGEDLVTDEMSEELDEASEFLDEVFKFILEPFKYEIDRFYKKYPRGLPQSNTALINWFLYNFYSIMKECKYYENIIGDFCDHFNGDKDCKLYMYLDNIEFMVYDNISKEFYIRTEDDKGPKVTTYSKYKKHHKNIDSWLYDDDTLKGRQEIFEKNLEYAKTKNLNKNIMFMLVFKFASTIRNFPMAIIDSKDLKIN